MMYLANKREEVFADVKAIQPKREDSCLGQCTAHSCHIIEIWLRVLDVSVKKKDTVKQNLEYKGFESPALCFQIHNKVFQLNELGKIHFE